MKIPNNRRGFTPKILPTVPIPEVKTFFKASSPLVYWNSKLSHTGLIGYKRFENCFRKPHANSLNNLLNQLSYTNSDLTTLVADFNNSLTNDQKSSINDKAVCTLNQNDFDKFLKLTHQIRTVNLSQCRKIASLSKKLAYYSQKRVFKSSKTGTYSMRTAFLTLTAPDTANPESVIKAFNSFLDYLQRTANCVYVWKKELGELNGNLHFHILINNFIPYYIISWKWKRLLLAQNVNWPLNADGVESNSHSRIELPKNQRQTAHYIAKYMSKAYDLPGNYGYISGHSSILNELKEISYIENDLPSSEIKALMAKYKTILHDHVSIVCCNLLEVFSVAPIIAGLFETQYIEFSNKITLPQKFTFV